MYQARVPAELMLGPFTTSYAAAFGVNQSMLPGDEWRHVFRNVWVHTSVPDDRRMRVQAVKLIMAEESFLFGLTAAWLDGIDPRDRRNNLVWVGSPTGRRPRTRPGCFVRELTVAPSDLIVVDGIRVTTQTRTAYDCARLLSRVEGVVVADALAHLGLTSQAELAAYAESHRGVRNVRQADQVVALMDANAESAMESRVRVFLIDSGLPALASQHEVFDLPRRFVARLDFAYPELKIAIEYDGAQHWEQRRDDDRRRDALRALGWIVIVISAEDLSKRADRVLAQIREAIASRI